MLKKESLFKLTPFIVQNSAISLFNSYQYKIWHGGAYKKFRNYYAQSDSLSESDLMREVEAKKIISLITSKATLAGIKVMNLKT